MPNYIDKDKLIRDLIDNRNFYPVIVKNAIENAPTEDVVPRSKVETIIDERDRYKKYYFRHEYDKWEAEIKQEVAREIFVELENIIIDHHTTPFGLEVLVIGDAQFNNLKKKYIGE